MFSIMLHRLQFIVLGSEKHTAQYNKQLVSSQVFVVYNLLIKVGPLSVN